jgi:glycosyltransferase involved in cell wall biosynthesis
LEENFMLPLVSILIPAFNAQRWISDTIRSAVTQSYPHKEIIIVDDGSRDETFAVAKRFASKDVVIVRQENQGPSAARNHAFSLCQGDYIQWLDADDLLSPTKVEKQLKSAQTLPEKRTLFSSEWGYFAYRSSQAKFCRSSLWEDLSPVEWLFRKMDQNLHMQTATWLVSRELTEVAGPWDARLTRDNDGEYFCRVILASAGIHFVPGAKVFYRSSPSGRVSDIGDSDHKKDSLFLSMQLHVKYIRSLEDSERVRVACMHYLQTWLIHFYPERPDIVQELENLAADLGGDLTKPSLRWKYAWIKPLSGWSAAKRAQFVLPKIRESLLRVWDKTMYLLETKAADRGRRIVDSEVGRNASS